MPKVNFPRLVRHFQTASVRRTAIALAVLAVLAATIMAGGRSAAAQPSDPAASLVGQRVETCKSGHPFAVEVASAEIVSSAQGRAADGGAAWLLLVVSAENTGGETGDLYMALALRDDQGRVSSFISPGSREEIDLADGLGVQAPFAALEPGATGRLLVTFQVSQSATSFTLLADPIHCS
jgi:hypothetical protein